MLNKFTNFIKDNFPSESDMDLFEINEQTMDVILANFYIKVRKENGEEYEPLTIKGFQTSIDRY